MKLRDMIRKKKSASDITQVAETPYDEEKYPYGLRINLEEDEIDKLGIDLKNFNIDDKVKIVGVAYVESLRQNKTRHGENKSLGLQITKMELKKTKIF